MVTEIPLNSRQLAGWEGLLAPAQEAMQFNIDWNETRAGARHPSQPANFWVLSHSEFCKLPGVEGYFVALGKPRGHESPRRVR